MRAFSHTSLSVFRNCPQRYKFQYVDKIRVDREYIESFLGKRVHETLEKLYKDVQHGRAPTLDETLRYYESGWEKHWSDRVRIVRPDYTAEDAREVGRRCLSAYYNRYHPFRQRVLGLERKVQVDIPDGDKAYLIAGFIDRVDETADGRYEIHDYKTSQNLPAQADVDKDRQLALYQIGIASLWPEAQKVELVWHYLVFDKELRSRRAPEDLARLKEDIRREIHAIEKETVFEPRVSALCDWCGYRDICPAWKQPLKAAALPAEESSRERGVNLVERYAHLEDKRETLRAELKRVEEDIGRLETEIVTYAEKEEITRLEGRDGQVEVHRKEELSLPTKSDHAADWDGLTKVLRDSPHWPEVSEVSRTRLKKALEDPRWDAALLEAISRFVHRVVKWSVRFHRRREEED